MALSTSAGVQYAKETASLTPFGVFARVPSEIRNMIYRPVFATGHTSIRRTSKTLYKDTAEALSKHGVWRVRIEHDFYLTNTYFQRGSTSLPYRLLYPNIVDIRNLNLSVVLLHPEFLRHSQGYATDTLARHIGSVVRHVSKPDCCNLYLELLDRMVVRTTYMEGLELLRCFDRVNVDVICPLYWEGVLIRKGRARPGIREGTIEAIRTLLQPQAGERRVRELQFIKRDMA